MKPFITPKTALDGKKIFEFQIEGEFDGNFYSLFLNNTALAFWLPAGHTLEEAWRFVLIFDGDIGIEFSSACTQILDWEEIGSLNIKFMSSVSTYLGMTEFENRGIICPPLSVRGIEKIIYEDAEVRTECGIAILSLNEPEIVIMTGVAPGSVTISAVFSKDKFEPEFSLPLCKREALTDE